MLKRTYQIQIKKGHKLYNYLQHNCKNAKNMYNVTNFHIRQLYTGLTTTKPLHNLQKEVLESVEKTLPKMNDAQLLAYTKKLEKQKLLPLEERKKVKANLFGMPTNKKPFIHYNFLDSYFKTSKNIDYLSLPTQSSQNIMKRVFKDWKAFFESLKDYKINPSKYTGKPNMPKYKSGLKECYFTNQDCVIKNNTFLKFPKTKHQLNIGKLGLKGKLKEVRIIPKYDLFVVELVMDMLPEKTVTLDENNVMAIDLGITNLATCTSNTGMTPCIFNGNPLKSVNQYYNKKRASLFSTLRYGKKPNEGVFTSKRLNKMDVYRYNKTKDYFHKVSKKIVQLAVEQQIGTIVIGKNKQWKSEVEMRKKTKQHFLFLSHELLIQMITYKAEALGIQVILQEESYTSKASSLDLDEIPTYGDELIPVFSGRRIKRGLYVSKSGIKINADVNGSYNILRKAFPDKGIEVVVSPPLKISVA